MSPEQVARMWQGLQSGLDQMTPEYPVPDDRLPEDWRWYDRLDPLGKEFMGMPSGPIGPEAEGRTPVYHPEDIARQMMGQNSFYKPHPVFPDGLIPNLPKPPRFR